MDFLHDYHRFGDMIASWMGSDKLAHIHAGLAIYLVVQLFSRSRRASGIALLAVVACESANEIADRLLYGSWRLDDTIGDVVCTLFWPVALHLLGRFRRLRWQVDQGKAKAASTPAVAPATDRPRPAPEPMRPARHSPALTLVANAARR